MRSKILAALGAFVLSAGAMQAQTGTTTTAPVDINTASRTQLADAGWGQYADAIIAARPYKSMNDLVEKKVVPQAAYDKAATRFTIVDGTTPLSNPGQSPTLNPPTATPSTDAADGDPGDPAGIGRDAPDGSDAADRHDAASGATAGCDSADGAAGYPDDDPGCHDTPGAAPAPVTPNAGATTAESSRLAEEVP